MDNVAGHLMIEEEMQKEMMPLSKTPIARRQVSACLHGAPSCSLRNNQGFTIDEQPPAHIGSDMPLSAGG